MTETISKQQNENKNGNINQAENYKKCVYIKYMKLKDG